MVVKQLGITDVFGEHLDALVSTYFLHLEDAGSIVGSFGQET